MSKSEKSNVFAYADNGGNDGTGNFEHNFDHYNNQQNYKDNNHQPHCPVQVEPGNAFFNKRIGATLYRVGIHFNPESKETLQDKILRLVKNDLNLLSFRATMESPQTGRLLERGSL